MTHYSRVRDTEHTRAQTTLIFSRCCERSTHHNDDASTQNRGAEEGDVLREQLGEHEVQHNINTGHVSDRERGGGRVSGADVHVQDRVTGT